MFCFETFFSPVDPYKKDHFCFFTLVKRNLVKDCPAYAATEKGSSTVSTEEIFLLST